MTGRERPDIGRTAIGFVSAGTFRRFAKPKSIEAFLDNLDLVLLTTPM